MQIRLRYKIISFHAISFTRVTQSVVQNNTAFRVPASGASMHFSSIPSVPENGQDVDGGDVGRAM